MSDLTVSAGAKATLTVEVTSLGSWSSDATADQIYRQAVAAAVARIAKVIHGEPSMKLIGEARITMILVQNERK